MPGPSNEAEQMVRTLPSMHERRPSEKVAQLAEALREKEDARCEAAERAKQHKRRKAILQQKAAQREQAIQRREQAAQREQASGNTSMTTELTHSRIQEHNIMTGRDPSFISSPPITSQSSQSNHRQQTSIVPAARPAPMNRMATPGTANRTPSRQVTGDDNDSNNDIDAGNDINNNDNVDNDIDGVDDEIGNGLASNINPDNLDDLDDEEPGEDNDNDNSKASPHPSCGDKRRHPHTGAWRQPVKVYVTTGARPKAHDYEIAVQKVLHEAILLYRGYLCTITPYPEPMEEIRWAKLSWKVAITSRSSHFRGRVKNKIQPLVKTMYNLMGNSKPGSVKHNISLVKDLKKGFNFYYAQAINDMWFNSKKDDGPRLPNIYKPFPKVALALVLTVIENCIDEWASGSQKIIPFTQDEYEKKFNEHLGELNRFDEFTKSLDMLPSLLQELHDEGCINAGVDLLEQPEQRAQSPSAYAAAMEEFKNGGYQASEASEEI